MNIRELRIGNLVKWIGKPCKVDLALLTTEFNDCKTEESSYVEPIEITEQMLLDNGFVLKKNGLFKGKEGINLLRSGDGWEGVIFNKTSHCDFYRDKIYLHELQNAYYLVNKQELDFKL